MDPHAHHHDEPEEVQSWAGDFDPFADPEERRVLFSTLDSFRYVSFIYVSRCVWAYVPRGGRPESVYPVFDTVTLIYSALLLVNLY